MCADLPETKSASVLSQSGNCYIGIDAKTIRSDREERMHLAHEMGHSIGLPDLYHYHNYTNVYPVYSITRMRKWIYEKNMKIAQTNGQFDI